ncbi:hypothetical protein LOTGIDRAFT_168174 [Lottia gigantea]|uniref:Uncharacterized protein n=1 Tax=Lottia gigantea TaxID=225164 RepID=V3ZKX1_LOTGI|nr:hypothetical protein LOTGIDRAFT_168174 [Lottia gigantea]ESO84917.1 hypothetical protein LOTGIDRAFT_168174 [Lottia gigantea]
MKVTICLLLLFGFLAVIECGGRGGRSVGDREEQAQVALKTYGGRGGRTVRSVGDLEEYLVAVNANLGGGGRGGRSVGEEQEHVALKTYGGRGGRAVRSVGDLEEYAQVAVNANLGGGGRGGRSVGEELKHACKFGKPIVGECDGGEFTIIYRGNDCPVVKEETGKCMANSAGNMVPVTSVFKSMECFYTLPDMSGICNPETKTLELSQTLVSDDVEGCEETIESTVRCSENDNGELVPNLAEMRPNLPQRRPEGNVPNSEKRDGPQRRRGGQFGGRRGGSRNGGERRIGGGQRSGRLGGKGNAGGKRRNGGGGRGQGGAGGRRGGRKNNE